MGPIACKRHLQVYLPNHPVIKDCGPTSGIGAVSAAPWGSSSILSISWMYIKMMGSEGLKLATQVAILNANYIAHRLKDHFPILYKGANGNVAHECIIDIRNIKSETGVTEEDIAKRMIDFGFHAPTMSWPVAGTMMIEPTESEGLSEIDRFCDTLIKIKQEIEKIKSGEFDKIDNPIKNAPHTDSELASDDWTHKYSRAEAAYPAKFLRANKLEIIFPNGAFLAERTSNKSFGIVNGLSIIGTSAETYSSASPDQLEEAKNNLAKLIQNDFKGEVIFVIGENGLNLAKTHNVNLPIIKIGNWIGPLLVDAAIKKVKTVILFGYHGKLIKLAGGIFHTHNHLADARIEILVYLAVQEKLPPEIIVELSQLDNLENALQLIERFNKSLADKLFKNLSNMIEKRSLNYVNRYVKTDMEIASIIFDKKRKIRWFGINGNKYISYFQ